MTLPRLDKYDIALGVVRARMALHFRLSPRGDPAAPKIFVIGFPRCGTTTLHRLFKANGLQSQHSAGDWKLDRFDAFSDFGQMRPIQAYDRTFQNARFILNTRPVYDYVESLLTHVYTDWRFTPRNIQREVSRHAAHLSWALTYFAGRDDFCLLDITAPDAVNRIAAWLDLPPPEAELTRPSNQRRTPTPERTAQVVQEGFAASGLPRALWDHPALTLADLGRDPGGVTLDTAQVTKIV